MKPYRSGVARDGCLPASAAFSVDGLSLAKRRAEGGLSHQSAVGQSKEEDNRMASLNYDEAAHLLRRAGFGGTPEDIDSLTTRGREGAVDYLLNYSQINNQAMDDLLKASFDFSNPSDNQKFSNGEIRRW